MIATLRGLVAKYDKMQMPEGLLDALAAPPRLARRLHLRANDRVLSRRTSRSGSRRASSAATPDCEQCGCMASAGLKAVGNHRLPGGLQLGSIFRASLAIGETVRGLREQFQASPANHRAAAPAVQVAPVVVAHPTRPAGRAVHPEVP